MVALYIQGQTGASSCVTMFISERSPADSFTLIHSRNVHDTWRKAPGALLRVQQ